MELHCYKYQGAGNDFIVIDARNLSEFRLTVEQISRMCHRRFGIGADGLMILTKEDRELDFEMLYYNSDGKEGSMCGNGGRCIVRFADDLGIGGTQKSFRAIDGVHTGRVLSSGEVEITMGDIERIHEVAEGWFVDSGSPHLIIEAEAFNVEGARRLRQRYDANVNFISVLDDRLTIRTYERGVEGETWACGTGAVAAAVVAGRNVVEARGGILQVGYQRAAMGFTNITLQGPAKSVFSLNINV